MHELDNLQSCQLSSILDLMSLLLIEVGGDCDNTFSHTLAIDLFFAQFAAILQDHAQNFLCVVNCFIALAVDTKGLPGNETSFICNEIIEDKFVI